MTISDRDATQQAPNKTGAARLKDADGGAGPRTFPALPSVGSVHISLPRRMHCSTCGQSYSSERIQRGSIHRGCNASPNGRYAMKASKPSAEAE